MGRMAGILMSAKSMPDYKADLNQRYWAYQQSQFPNDQSIFDPRHTQAKGPPVFIPSEAWRNIILNPTASQPEIDLLLALVPAGEKHKWYRSMNSSQALALSVLGNLKMHGFLQELADIQADEGGNLFGAAQLSADNFVMEYKVNYLGEPRPTSLDGYISGEYRVAIECKFTEADIGACSRPALKPSASNYEGELCSGTYSVQRGRKERCSLTEVGVLYWRYVPALFNWKNDQDFVPCPLYRNYQLVRNVLAAGVRPDGSVSIDHGHAVLIYDARNPAFHNGGKGLAAYRETQEALRAPTMLRKCSWQRIVQRMREKEILPWLAKALSLKYGL
jgi:hypothetical protein